MVTTQPTGRAIVHHHDGGNLVAAHVQPTSILAETACTNLRADATPSQAPGNAVTAVLGPQNPREVDPRNHQKQCAYDCCTRVRSGGHWELYARQRAPGVGGNMVAWRIT